LLTIRSQIKGGFDVEPQATYFEVDNLQAR